MSTTSLDWTPPVGLPRLTVAEATAAILILVDVALTHHIATHGPATEIGIGAVHWIATFGWPGHLAAQLLAATVIFGGIRLIEQRGAAFADQLRGAAAGFWMWTAVSNLSFAIAAGVIPP